jgi:uncharacterized HAD superfamily protein
MNEQAPSQVIALTAEAEALHAQIACLRREDGRMRSAIVQARHHIALALRALNLDLPAEQPADAAMASTDRYGNGG